MTLTQGVYRLVNSTLSTFRQGNVTALLILLAGGGSADDFGLFLGRQLCQRVKLFALVDRRSRDGRRISRYVADKPQICL